MIPIRPKICISLLPNFIIINYEKTVPDMAKLNEYLEESNLGKILHDWHYNTQQESAQILNITKIVEQFISWVETEELHKR